MSSTVKATWGSRCRGRLGLVVEREQHRLGGVSLHGEVAGSRFEVRISPTFSCLVC